MEIRLLWPRFSIQMEQRCRMFEWTAAAGSIVGVICDKNHNFRSLFFLLYHFSSLISFLFLFIIFQLPTSVRKMRIFSNASNRGSVMEGDDVKKRFKFDILNYLCTRAEGASMYHFHFSSRTWKTQKCNAILQKLSTKPKMYLKMRNK